MKRSHFRHVFLAAFVVLSVFSAVLLTEGCKKKCGSVTCQNGGTCTNDTCVCPSGYTGTSCETLWSTSYLGSYTCSQTCAPPITGTASWQSVVATASTNGSYTITITNFGNLNVTVTATIDGSGNITVPEGNGVAGSGVFANNVMTIHYTTSTNNVPGSQCTLTMNKN